jgi:ribonucleoside-diphosphate reductase alpha chain
MLKVFNNTAKYVDQGGGKRNGSFAIYLEPWHADIEMFLQMRKNHGDEELRARDLFYALWVPDLFMERVRDGGDWTLMCPNECPGLADVTGSEFVALYSKYEKEGKGRETMPARKLWFQIMDAQMETGTPYLLFKDAANNKSNQKNVGVIKSSNLCVSPQTRVLTREGYFPIYALYSGNFPEHEKDKHDEVEVWNGDEFSKVHVFKTGEDCLFIEVITDDGCRLTCTPYHKFYIRDGTGGITVKEAIELLPGDLLEQSSFPILDDDGKESFAVSASVSGCNSGKTNLKYDDTLTINVPVNYTRKDKMDWLAAFIEPFVVQAISLKLSYVEIQSASRVLLEDLKYLLQTCGVNTVVRDCENDHFPIVGTWTITFVQLRFLRDNDLLTKFNTFKWEEIPLSPAEMCSSDMHPSVRVLKIRTSELTDDSYCFTEPKKHAGIFNGMRTGQCTEIIQYSDKDETAVCNLASLALPSFVDMSGVFNFELLHKTTRIVTRNLNKVIDINFYPTPKTEVSNKRHRPVGLGVQGLADTFFMMKLSFTSEKAKLLNKHIFETIYHAALEESLLLAQEEGRYDSFDGSPASHGLLQFDLWNVEPNPGRYDWDDLKERIKKDGLRNSLLVAPMPTASTSQILGYNECIEPVTSNIYSRRTLAGEFIMVNKYLMKEMLEKDLWNETFKNHMIANNGSIQNLEYLDPEIRERYRTVWEIPMRDLIDMAADRGPFICQSQSLNLWLEDPNYKSMTTMHFYSWNKGLKTGIYYLRRRPRHHAQQFTIEPSKKEEEECLMCSA